MMSWFWLRLYPQRVARTMSFVEGHSPLKPVGKTESRLSLTTHWFSKDMFLIKDGMNTHKKQKTQTRNTSRTFWLWFKKQQQQKKPQNRTFAGKEK